MSPTFVERPARAAWMLLLLLGPPALGASTGTVDAEAPSADPAVSDSAPVSIPREAQRDWAFSASVYGYVVPEGPDYLQPTVTADRGALHLEARYQYEALETGSVWVGYTFSGGGSVNWEFTPMLGGDLGETMGVAPGFRGSVAWWWLELASEGECVVDAGDTSDSFLYSWTELTLGPVDWVRFGAALQRTRVYGEDREVQWGPMVGFSFGRLDLAAYLFNLDEDRPVAVFAVSASY